MLSLSEFVSQCKNLSTRFSAEESTKFKNLSENAFPACKMCQVENERSGRNSLSKSENWSNRTDLKTNFKKSPQEFGSLKKWNPVKLRNCLTKLIFYIFFSSENCNFLKNTKIMSSKLKFTLLLVVVALNTVAQKNAIESITENDLSNKNNIMSYLVACML